MDGSMHLSLLALLVFPIQVSYRVLGGEVCGKGGSPRCETPRPDKLVCSSYLPATYLQPAGEKRRSLYFCRFIGPRFDPGILSHFPHLQKFTLVRSNISYFTSVFPDHSNLQFLNLSRLQLTSLELQTFHRLSALKVLDLSYNRLKYVDKYMFEFIPNLQQLHLKGNDWDCQQNLKWFAGRKQRILVDPEQLVCSQEKYNGKPVIPVMAFIRTLEAECPRTSRWKCQCSLDNVVWSQEADHLIPVMLVNCASLGLTSLPTNLPSNTTILLLSNNNISDVSTIVSDSTYYQISDIYLDNNQIEKVDVLEGAVWLNNFRTLSLKSNNLKVLPTYLFDNVFEKNVNAAQVFFGNNPWACDCTFTPIFKELISKHHTLIQDLEDIRCGSSEKYANMAIRDLSRTTVCVEVQEALFTGVDCLNMILTLLIIIVICKFLYDYWVFKTSGKLPWIAMKFL